ncbi:MAG: (d)CMP kinase [Bacillaceae bacterium]|nr:(d)CMP kinase [Bacillaceae bacterium]
MSTKINIAIDGPAGAGKSTVAKLVAEKIGYTYIDTGAMYRAITYKAINHNVDLLNGKALGALASVTRVELKRGSNIQQLVFVDGEDVTELIRTAEVTNNVSHVAAHKDVRLQMLHIQQQIAENGGVVMDGRDIGTAVLPSAEVKIFLSATVDERARRRHEENLAKGYPSDFERLKAEIALRDKRDSERETAPLKKAEDAIEIDSTSMTIQEVVSNILTIVKERA